MDDIHGLTVIKSYFNINIFFIITTQCRNSLHISSCNTTIATHPTFNADDAGR